MPPKLMKTAPVPQSAKPSSVGMSATRITTPIKLDLLHVSEMNKPVILEITEDNVMDELQKVEDGIMKGIRGTKDQSKLETLKNLLNELNELENLASDYTANQKNISRKITFITQSLNSLK